MKILVAPGLPNRMHCKHFIQTTLGKPLIFCEKFCHGSAVMRQCGCDRTFTGAYTGEKTTVGMVLDIADPEPIIKGVMAQIKARTAADYSERAAEYGEADILDISEGLNLYSEGQLITLGRGEDGFRLIPTSVSAVENKDKHKSGNRATAVLHIGKKEGVLLSCSREDHQDNAIKVYIGIYSRDYKGNRKWTGEAIQAVVPVRELVHWAAEKKLFSYSGGHPHRGRYEL